MKLEKITAKKAVGVVGQTTGFVGGMVLSNGVSDAIPVENKNTARAIVAAAGLVGALVIPGSSSIAKTGKAASIGMAAQQLKEIVVDVIKPHLPENNGKVAQFVNASLENNGPKLIAAPTPVKNPKQLGNPHLFRMANAAAVEQPKFAMY